ncbi:hypothetical protein BGX21_006708 [Mortierella sp. AD011]|nr:hypothetical protein BGX20_010662 [Mortierella sp. AD010]KAF9399167.1 hypothetical protein BGX21_006708 [Mortierella sp. AD011]
MDPTGLDFDLPPPQPTNPSSHITTIHEADEEEENEYVHIQRSASSISSSPYPYSEKQGPLHYHGQYHHGQEHSTTIPLDHHQTPPRSLTSSPSVPSPYSSPQQPLPQQQPPTRYQYPRTRSNQLGGGTGSSGLPLYASRTQRLRNGHSSSLDQGGKTVYRGSQPRISSSSIGGLSSDSGSDDDDEYFIGGRGSRSGINKSFATFRNRRRRAWYMSRELHIVTAICVLSLIVRLWHIGNPTSVVFDEVHFGGFASKYIKGRFFMDVHPPLAKMLIALTGWLFGLNPSFDFKEIGLDYLAPKVPYVAMRMLCGLMGVAVVPMAFYTIKNSGHSMHASILAAILILFENATVTQSRLILLDSPLIFFTAFTVLAWTNFHNQRKYPFSDEWFIWLLFTGLGLGLSLSVKWVGLFIIATVGTSTINQLWLLWGDLRVTPRVWLDHFLARAVCLILVPAIVYMFMFEIHFLLLENSGDGDGFMSAPFQMTLGYSLKDSPLSVAYGATVTIRHQGTQGGYLHSHPSDYETGSKREDLYLSKQQITLYPHKDSNNDWIIQKRDGSVPGGLEYVKHGDYVRLLHVPTNRRLHSHNNKAPVTEDENHFEVSAYGEVGFAGDANDEWRVEIVDYEGKDKAAGRSLHTLRSKFKLVHPNMACDLFSHKVKLPKWGFEQQEVTCMRSAVVSKTTWMIETNTYDKYPDDAPMVNYKRPGFFGKFLELNKVMWTTNAGLTDSHPYDSRPSSWIWLRRGISFWGKDNRHIYLIGNWFTWYLSTFSVVLYAVIRVLLVIRDKRGYRDNFRGLRDYYELSGGFFFMAWCYHYLPFFLMGRQLFLHHYLPALYFAILLFCVTFDLACRFIPNRYRIAALVVVSLTAIYVFRARSSLVYGSEWTWGQCESSKLLKTWDYDCYQFPMSYDDYKTKHMVGRIIDPPAPESDNKPHDFLEHLLPHAPEPQDAEKDQNPQTPEGQGVGNNSPAIDPLAEENNAGPGSLEGKGDTGGIEVEVEEDVGEGGDDEETEDQDEDTAHEDDHDDPLEDEDLEETINPEDKKLAGEEDEEEQEDEEQEVVANMMDVLNP